MVLNAFTKFLGVCDVSKRATGKKLSLVIFVVLWLALTPLLLASSGCFPVVLCSITASNNGCVANKFVEFFIVLEPNDDITLRHTLASLLLGMRNGQFEHFCNGILERSSQSNPCIVRQFHAVRLDSLQNSFCTSRFEVEAGAFGSSNRFRHFLLFCRDRCNKQRSEPFLDKLYDKETESLL